MSTPRRTGLRNVLQGSEAVVVGHVRVDPVLQDHLQAAGIGVPIEAGCVQRAVVPDAHGLMQNLAPPRIARRTINARQAEFHDLRLAAARARPQQLLVRGDVAPVGHRRRPAFDDVPCGLHVAVQADGLHRHDGPPPQQQGFHPLVPRTVGALHRTAGCAHHRIHVRPGVEQRLRHRVLAVGGCVPQRHAPALHRLVDVGQIDTLVGVQALGEQQVQHRRLPVGRRQGEETSEGPGGLLQPLLRDRPQEGEVTQRRRAPRRLLRAGFEQRLCGGARRGRPLALRPSERQHRAVKRSQARGIRLGRALVAGSQITDQRQVGLRGGGVQWLSPLRVDLGDALRGRLQQPLDPVEVTVPDRIEQLVAPFRVGARLRGAAVQLATDERDEVVVAAVLGQGQRRGGVAVRVDALVGVRTGLQEEARAGQVAVEHRVVQGGVLVVLRPVQPHQVGAGGHQRADGRKVPLLRGPEEARSGSALHLVRPQPGLSVRMFATGDSPGSSIPRNLGGSGSSSTASRKRYLRLPSDRRDAGIE